MSSTNLSEEDPLFHVGKVKGMIGDVIKHLRQDIPNVTEPKAQALFETLAEVLTGAKTACEHYEEQRPAWRHAA